MAKSKDSRQEMAEMEAAFRGAVEAAMDALMEGRPLPGEPAPKAAQGPLPLPAGLPGGPMRPAVDGPLTPKK
jgi:hypothetical protein